MKFKNEYLLLLIPIIGLYIYFKKEKTFQQNISAGLDSAFNSSPSFDKTINYSADSLTALPPSIGSGLSTNPNITIK